MGLSDGQRVMVRSTRILCFSKSLLGLTEACLSPLAKGNIPSHYSSLSRSTSTHRVLTWCSCSLSFPFLSPSGCSQVSFCWRSLVCWKRLRWRRRRRVWTAESLMLSSVQPTCSGECWMGRTHCEGGEGTRAGGGRESFYGLYTLSQGLQRSTASVIYLAGCCNPLLCCCSGSQGAAILS